MIESFAASGAISHCVVAYLFPFLAIISMKTLWLMNIYVYYHIRFKSGLANNIYIYTYMIYIIYQVSFSMKSDRL